MQTCNIPVADGTKPYVFLLFHPGDASKVYPLLELLTRKGLRIWYDNETMEKDSHWVETYASFLCKANMCLTLLTEHIFESHEYRNQLLIATNAHIQLLSIYLDNVRLSAGEQMLITNGKTLQCSINELDQAVSAILSEKEISPCIGVPNPEFRVQYGQEAPKQEPAQYFKGFSQLIPNDEPKGFAPAPLPENQPVPVPVSTPTPVSAPINTSAFASASVSKPTPIPVQDPPSMPKTSILSGTVVLEYQYDGQQMGTLLLTRQEERPLILRLSTGEYKEGNSDFTTIGRNPYCDFSLQGEKETGISEYHLRIVLRDGKKYLVDTEHSNGSFYAGERLPENKPVEVTEDVAPMKLGAEDFIVFFGKAAEQIKGQEAIFGLRSNQTLETRYILHDEMALGRNHPWNGGVLTAGTTSAEHAAIRMRDGQCMLWDTSTNGTFVNEKRIEREKETAVSVGDQIRLAQECFTVVSLPLTEKE